GVRTTICEGESHVLGGNPTGPVGSLFKWTPSDDLISPVTANPEASPLDTTLYTVFVTDLNGCVNSSRVRLDVKSKPQLELLDKEKYICHGDSGAVYVTDGLLNYSWSPEQWVLNPHKPETFIFPPSTTIMSVTAEGFNGCFATVDFEMEVKPLPEVYAGEDVEICEGDTVAVFGSSEAKKTVWSPAEFVEHADLLTTMAYPVSRTVLYLTATDQYDCQNTDDVLIYVYPYPHADAGENIDNCHIETIFLGTEYTADPENFITWEPSENLSDPHAQNPYVLSPDNMTYYLTVETPQGCINTDSIYVEADCYSRVYIPSSFSPNGDDVNDLFLISTYRIQNPNIVIRDKWGHVVFETNDITVGWDGMVNGVEGAIGVYYFELVYETESGKVQGEKSTLTLIR
ncbi:MAG: gliding motility-associated C-terminal domain-containing protein, partial [Flavobacteriales bacterium]